MESGQEGLFSAFAEQGDVAYMEFWNRVKNKPEETVYNDIGEGLKQMVENRVVIHVNEPMLWQYFQDRPYINQKIQIVAKEKFQFRAIILTKNSPLTPIFKSGMVSHMQGGVTDRLQSKYTAPQSKGIFDEMFCQILPYLNPSDEASFSSVNLIGRFSKFIRIMLSEALERETNMQRPMNFSCNDSPRRDVL